MENYQAWFIAVTVTFTVYMTVTTLLDMLFGERWRYAIGFVRYVECEVCYETMFKVDALRTFVKYMGYKEHCSACQYQIDRWNTPAVCGHYPNDLKCIQNDCW